MTITKIKRGRPRAFNKEKAQAIALKLFWEDGYEATGMSKLTKEIGIAAPSLYAAFGSKAGIFAEAVELYQTKCSPFFEEAFEAEEASEFINQLFNSAVKSYTQKDQGKGCLVLDGTRNASDPEALAITESLREELHKKLVEKLRDLCVVNPVQAADACQTAMIGLSGAARHGLSQKNMLDVARVLAKGIYETSK